MSTRLASWIAIAAMVFSALAPTIAHAIPAKNTPQTLWQELCTAQGTQLIASDAISGASSQPGLHIPTQPAQDKMGMHVEHCPYCFSHAGSIGLPPVTASFVFVATGQRARLAETYIAPVISPHYQSANPSQAPPVLY
ncbi:MAG: DUF2946 domain-containing protein [Methylophilaceae bacterium]